MKNNYLMLLGRQVNKFKQLGSLAAMNTGEYRKTPKRENNRLVFFFFFFFLSKRYIQIPFFDSRAKIILNNCYKFNSLHIT